VYVFILELQGYKGESVWFTIQPHKPTHIQVGYLHVHVCLSDLASERVLFPFLGTFSVFFGMVRR
jgi:hypothetical protein